jgi:type I restriction enzyme M protein
VPLGEDVDAYFEREVKPHVPDAWIDQSYADEKDGGVGIVGYETNFNRYFYPYQPPRPLEEIEAGILALQHEIVALLQDVTGAMHLEDALHLKEHLG